MSKIVFVTSNDNKLREVESILGIRLNRINIDIEEIQDIDVEKVVEKKAKDAYEKIRKRLIVEDTGLYIEALNGLPGALIRWFLKTIGTDGICKIVNCFEKRDAYVKTAVALFDGKNMKIFVGIVKGKISINPRGSGFGWDSIFIPKGSTKTFGEMSKEEKNSISMRYKAFQRLKRFLEL